MKIERKVRGKLKLGECEREREREKEIYLKNDSLISYISTVQNI